MSAAGSRPRVLVVDDSAVVRQAVRTLLEGHAGIGEVETAVDGRAALRKLDRFAPDVITLDVEMPGLDGLATLKRIMSQRPCPVIMLSAFTHEGAHRTLRALELGAVDFITKPGGALTAEMPAVAEELIAKVQGVAGRAVAPRTAPPPLELLLPSQAGLPHDDRRRVPAPASADMPVVVIGASTGGTEAIRAILTRLPGDLGVGIAVVQHMPEGYTRAFAERLHEQCALEVREAGHRDLLLPGRALIAPGHSHLVLRRGVGALYVELSRGPRVRGHRPSVDLLLHSAAESLGSSAMGVILTGMGRDGASGLLAIHRAGGTTLAQDEASSVVYGMPRAAVEEGGAQRVVSLERIPGLIRSYVLAQRLGSARGPI